MHCIEKGKLYHLGLMSQSFWKHIWTKRSSYQPEVLSAFLIWRLNIEPLKFWRWWLHCIMAAFTPTSRLSRLVCRRRRNIVLDKKRVCQIRPRDPFFPQDGANLCTRFLSVLPSSQRKNQPVESQKASADITVGSHAEHKNIYERQ